MAIFGYFMLQPAVATGRSHIDMDIRNADCIRTLDADSKSEALVAVTGWKYPC